MALNCGAMTTMVDVMRWYSSLVRLKAHSEVIELAHFTVKEFLLNIDPTKQASVAEYKIDIVEDECYLAKNCLTILNFEEFSINPPPRHSEGYAWVASKELQDAYSYASVYWPIHASKHIEKENICQSIKSLFTPIKSYNFVWWAGCFAFKAERSFVLDTFSSKVALYPDITTLHWAACLGLSNIVEWLFQDGNVYRNPKLSTTPYSIRNTRIVYNFR